MRDYPNPFDELIERQVLGSLLLDNTRIDDVAPILVPDDFFYDRHQVIYALMLEQRRSSSPCDFMTLATILDQRQVKGIELDDIRALYDAVATGIDAEYHAGRVLALAKKRRLLDLAEQFKRSIAEAGEDTDEAAAAMVRKVEAVRSQGARMRGQSFAELADETLDIMEKMRNGEVLGHPTPWRMLNQMTGGLEPGRLVVVAGRPAQGKSCIALNLIRAVAAQQIGVFCMSLEMGGRELFIRALSSETCIPGNQIARTPATLMSHQLRDLRRAAADLAKLNVTIDSGGGATIDDLIDASRAYIRRNGVGLVVVDYIGQLNTPKSLRSVPRPQQIGAITRALKQLALEYQIPVVALSQLNRDSEKRENKEPVLADLRESGDVEQDADVVLMVHRPGEDNSAKLLVRKNRSGPSGCVDLLFHAPTTTFYEPDDYHRIHGNGHIATSDYDERPIF